mmetsp:Transcript_36644/g.59232  ORF Transcript_36644/g.59232 Transcript_36644/m.59232 type:complete len:119 (-) Transcript_36644:341-697(-)
MLRNIALRRVVASTLQTRTLHSTSVVAGGATTTVPPHRPLSAPLPEEADLIWDDGARPESALDDHSWYGISTGKAIATLGGVLLGMVGLFQFAKNVWNPEENRPTLPRKYTMPNAESH